MIFKLAEQKDIPKILSELKRFFGKNYYGANKRFFNWLYKKNPYLKIWNKNATFSVALLKSSKGKILCISCFLPWEVMCKGKKYSAMWDIEWLNVSKTKGLGRKIIKSLEKYFDLYLGFGYNSLAARGYKKLKYSLFGEIDRKIYIISKLRLNKLLEPLNGNKKIIFPNQIKVPFRKYKFVKSLKQISNQPFSEYSKKNYISAKSKELLEWRYLRHPFIKYKFLTSNYNDLAVLRDEVVRGTRQKVLRILEIFPTAKSRNQIVNAVLSYAKKSNFILVDFFCVSRFQSDKVLGKKFMSFERHRKFDIPYLFNPVERRTRKSINFVYKKIKNMPFKPSEFYATKGDGDQDVLLNTDYVTKKL